MAGIGFETLPSHIIESTRNKTQHEISIILQQHDLNVGWGGWGSERNGIAGKGAAARWFAQMKPGAMIMMRFSSATGKCPITKQMIPSLFDGTMLDKKYKTGIYLIGRVSSYPYSISMKEAPRLFHALGWSADTSDDTKIGSGDVDVDWLRMGMLSDLKNIKISLQQTFSIVQSVESVKLILQKAVYKVPTLQNVSDFSEIRKTTFFETYGRPDVDRETVFELLENNTEAEVIDMLAQ